MTSSWKRFVRWSVQAAARSQAYGAVACFWLNGRWFKPRGTLLTTCLPLWTTSGHWVSQLSCLCRYSCHVCVDTAVMSVSIPLSCLCRYGCHVCVDSALMSVSIQLSCLCRFSCHVCVDSPVMSVSSHLSCLCRYSCHVCVDTAVMSVSI